MMKSYSGENEREMIVSEGNKKARDIEKTYRLNKNIFEGRTVGVDGVP